MHPLARRLCDRLARLWSVERPGGRATIALRQPLLLVAFILLGAWYIGRPSPLAALSVTALGGLLVAGYFWARQLAWGVAVRRQLNYAAVQVGDEIEETVTLTNESVLPVLWAEFLDHSNIPGYNLSSVRATGGQSSIAWHPRATCTQRGNYRFGPWELLTSDPFGLFQVALVYDQQEEILVYPPLAPLPEQIIPRGRAQGDDRILLQPLRADSTSAYSTRPYAPGDPLRRVHWPSTARHSTPFVKLFDPEASATIWLIPDLDAAVQRGEGPASTLEMIIIFLASLADRLLDEHLAVGMIACTPLPQVILPARGRPQFWQILRLLAGLQPTTLPFARVLGEARAVISGRQRVMVVTPSLQPEWVGQLHQFGAASRRPVSEVILLDPYSFGEQGAAQANGDANSRREEIGAVGSSAGAFLSYLVSLGVPARVLRRGDIQPRLASYGELSHWEFRVLGTGRAYARRTPHKLVRHLPPQPANRSVSQARS